MELALGPVADGGGNLGLCGKLAVHKGAGFHFAELELHAQIAAFKVKPVAGNHLAAKFYAIKAGEEKELVVQAFHAGNGQQAACLPELPE